MLILISNLCVEQRSKSIHRLNIIDEPGSPWSPPP